MLQVIPKNVDNCWFTALYFVAIIFITLRLSPDIKLNQCPLLRLFIGRGAGSPTLFSTDAGPHPSLNMHSTHSRTTQLRCNSLWKRRQRFASGEPCTTRPSEWGFQIHGLFSRQAKKYSRVFMDQKWATVNFYFGTNNPGSNEARRHLSYMASVGYFIRSAAMAPKWKGREPVLYGTWNWHAKYKLTPTYWSVNYNMFLWHASYWARCTVTYLNKLMFWH